MKKATELDINIPDLVTEMAQRLNDDERITSASQSVVVGIQTGGVWIAQALAAALNIGAPIGSLGISFYRDDFSRIGFNPKVRPSELPPTLDDACVILVDDILHTGRTIRAAMNELFDYGRPQSIVLAVLVDRGGRELPIEADTVGTTIELKPSQHVKLLGPDPLSLKVMEP